VETPEDLWERHGEEWRDPAQIANQWREAAATDPQLLRSRARGRFWELLEERALTLIVTREYEHLIMALSVAAGRPHVTFMPLPHPSGIAIDKVKRSVHVASTRNPNQIYEFEPATGDADRPLVPVRSTFLPGSLYLHDLAFVGGELHGNAVGHNAVVALPRKGGWNRVWWPRSIERSNGPDFTQNYLQLNSIAAGPTIGASYFSASAAEPSARRPGHQNFPVDRRGVIFGGATREPVAEGLTRPHSARLSGGRLWVDNSGYGELVAIADGDATVVARLPGWTRGLWLGDDLAFVGTSRVIPRFRSYAPGLDVDASVCGVHAVDLGTGSILGSLVWPAGNQIFGIEAVDTSVTGGFPFTVARGAATDTARTRAIFYSFSTGGADR
jgi:uncharacterized protein (TIGR03032 family)